MQISIKVFYSILSLHILTSLLSSSEALDRHIPFHIFFVHCTNHVGNFPCSSSCVFHSVFLSLYVDVILSICILLLLNLLKDFFSSWRNSFHLFQSSTIVWPAKIPPAGFAGFPRLSTLCQQWLLEFRLQRRKCDGPSSTSPSVLPLTPHSLCCLEAHFSWVRHWRRRSVGLHNGGIHNTFLEYTFMRFVRAVECVAQPFICVFLKFLCTLEQQRRRPLEVRGQKVFVFFIYTRHALQSFQCRIYLYCNVFFLFFF